jgi:hypothetical protein
MSRWSWIPVLVLAVSACGGNAGEGGNDVVESGAVLVESANGLASVSLPPGSLPSDVSIDDVALEVIVDEDAELGAPVVAVRLLPDGLLLGEAAKLTVALPEVLTSGFMAIHVSGDTIEFLGGAVTPVDDRLSFVTSIAHFSDVNFNTARIATGSMVLTPSEVSKGQTQQADAIVTMKSDPVPLFIQFNSDPRFSWRKFVFSAPMPPFRFDQALPHNSSRVYWDNQLRQEFWDPDFVLVDVLKADAGWEAHAESTCIKENQHDVFLKSEVQFNVEVLAAGPPVQTSFLNFSQVFTQEAIETPHNGFGEIELLDVSPGDIIEATAFVFASAPTVCKGGDSSASSSESSTESQDGGDTVSVPPGLDPRAHIVSVTPYVTDDGTHGFIVGFSQGWDGAPVLYSFFIDLVAVSGDCSTRAGYERHAGTEATPGPGSKQVLDDGTFAFETDCPYNPDNVFEVTGRSGSQAESTSTATFDTFVEHEVPTADATTVDPSRIVVVIDAGTPDHLKAAQPIQASNNGENITITFAGDVKALVDGGAYKVTINAQATDGGIRVTVTLRSTNGELLLNGATINDADAVGGSIDGKKVETTWVWSSGNRVVIGMDSPEGVAIPSTSPSISVNVQETESSDEFGFNFQ